MKLMVKTEKVTVEFDDDKADVRLSTRYQDQAETALNIIIKVIKEVVDADLKLSGKEE
jgi:urocanate hydratase